MRIKRYLIAGVLIWVPVGLVLLIVNIMVEMADRTLLLLPADFHPDTVLGVHIPGLGIVLTLAVLMVTGFVVTNYFGRKLVGWGEALVARIPVVRSLYHGAKQVLETMLSDGGTSFKKVLLVQYPKEGVWSIAFQTNTSAEEVQARTGDEVICAFIPTTPNPTSGFLVMLPRKDVVEMDMSVDDALKMIISLGVVSPRWLPPGSVETARAAPLEGEGPGA